MKLKNLTNSKQILKSKKKTKYIYYKFNTKQKLQILLFYYEIKLDVLNIA